MSVQSVIEAEDGLAALVDRVLAGEVVLITRRGQPVAEIKPVGQAGRPVTPADLDWLAARRVGKAPARTDAGTLVSETRDEDWR